MKLEIDLQDLLQTFYKHHDIDPKRAEMEINLTTGSDLTGMCFYTKRKISVYGGNLTMEEQTKDEK